MRPGFVAVSITLLLAGCKLEPVRPIGPVPVARGSIEQFTPLVAGSQASAQCEELDGSQAGPGGRGVALKYDDARRQVTVLLDAQGEPIRYLDVRGDLSIDDDRVEDRTTIGLYVREGYAVVSNRPSGGSPGVMEIPLDEAYASERLGNPGEVLSQVLAMCASPSD